MNNLLEKILYEYINFGCISNLSILGIDIIEIDKLANMKFDVIKNDDFEIYEKFIYTKNNKRGFLLKIYFFQKKYYTTGVNTYNIRFKSLIKSYLRLFKKPINSFKIFKDNFCEDYYAILINNNVIIRLSLQGKKNRKNFFVDNLEPMIPCIENEKLNNVPQDFLNNNFYELDISSISKYELELFNLLTQLKSR